MKSSIEVFPLTTLSQGWEDVRFQIDEVSLEIKSPWYQRFALWLLQKTKARVYKPTRLIETMTVHYDDIWKFVKAQMTESLNREWRPHTIYLGAEQFDEITGRQDIMHYMRFQVPPDADTIYPSLLGCRVIVIPWWNGALVVPEDKK
jgi:hypothetical protein